jgi:hypothetical protein
MDDRTILINFGAIAITAKAVVDARPVRYHLSELEDYIRGRLMGIRRPVTTGDARRWGEKFAIDKIATDDDGNMHRNASRDLRNAMRRKGY